MEVNKEVELMSNGGDAGEIQAATQVHVVACSSFGNEVTHSEADALENNASSSLTEYNITGGNFSGAHFGTMQQNYNMQHTINHYHLPEQTLHRTETKRNGEDITFPSSVSLCKTERLNPHSNSLNEIYKGFCKLGILPRKSCAVKIIPCNSANQSYLQQVNTLNELCHENIVRLFAAGIYKHNSEQNMFMAMELCDVVPLFDVIKNLESGKSSVTFSNGLSYSHELVEGLHYIHSKEKIHGELNPHNILLSITSQKTTIKIAAGFRRTEEHFTQALDMYSLGTSIFFVLTTGKRTFDLEQSSWSHPPAEPNNQYLQRAFKKYLYHTDFKFVSRLLEQMLHGDPESRPTSASALRDLRKAFELAATVKPHTLAEHVQSASLQDSSFPSTTEKSLAGLNLNQRSRVGACQISARASEKATDLMLFDFAHQDVIRYTPKRDRIQSFEGWPGTETEHLSTSTGGHFSAVACEEWVYVFKDTGIYRMRYASRHPAWRKVATMESSHGPSPPLVALQGMIYVLGGEKALGGHSKWTATAKCTRYNPTTKRWDKLASMETKRRSHAIVAWKACIYCFGGRNESQLQISNVERFDANDGRQGRWTTIGCHGITLHHSSAAVVFEEKIYVIGGFDGKTRVNAIQLFHPADNQWTSISHAKEHSMLRRACFRAWVVDNRIYVVGGKDSLDKDHGVVEAIELVKKGNGRIEARSHRVKKLDKVMVEGEGTVALTL